MHRIQKTARELLSGAPAPTVTPDTPVGDALEKMRSTGSTGVLVLENDEIVGIFTDRDAVFRLAADTRPLETPMRDLMSSPVESLTDTDCVTDAITQMAAGGHSNIPVLTADGSLVGLLGVRDVLAHLSDVLEAFEIVSEQNGG